MPRPENLGYNTVLGQDIALGDSSEPARKEECIATLLPPQNRAGSCSEHAALADIPYGLFHYTYNAKIGLRCRATELHPFSCTLRRQTLDEKEREVNHATRAI